MFDHPRKTPGKAGVLHSFSTGLGPDLIPGAAIATQAVTPGANQADCERANQEHALQLQSPNTLGIETADLVAVGQQQGNDHIHGYNQTAGTGVKAQNHQDGSNHFAYVHAPGQKAGHIVGDQHSFDSSDAITYLGDAVQQDQHTDRDTQQEFSKIITRHT